MATCRRVGRNLRDSLAAMAGIIVNLKFTDLTKHTRHEVNCEHGNYCLAWAMFGGKTIQI